MFLIPDLTKMEVEVSVHESMGPRVRVGMKAKVRLASQPDQIHCGPGRRHQHVADFQLERVGRNA